MSKRIQDCIREVKDFPKRGISFKDITPLLKDYAASQELIDIVAKQFEGQIDVVIGIESRGFMYGFALAMRLGVPFVPIRKKGKLPHKTISVRYALEYGEDEVEMHLDAIDSGQRVLIHDDLLATGGTAAAASELVKIAGGKVMGYSFIVHLAFLEGRKKLSPIAQTFIV